jgi:hypothetical protein
MSPGLDTEGFHFRNVTGMGGKVKVMELMSHESPDVRYQALIAVSV